MLCIRLSDTSPYKIKSLKPVRKPHKYLLRTKVSSQSFFISKERESQMFHISKIHPLECQVYGQSHRGERDLRRLQTSSSPILIQFKNIQIVGMSFESLNLYSKMFFETIIYKCIRFKEPQGYTTLGDLRPRNKVIQSFRLGFCILGMFQVCSCFFFFFTVSFIFHTCIRNKIIFFFRL